MTARIIQSRDEVTREIQKFHFTFKCMHLNNDDNSIVLYIAESRSTRISKSKYRLITRKKITMILQPRKWMIIEKEYFQH